MFYTYTCYHGKRVYLLKELKRYPDNYLHVEIIDHIKDDWGTATPVGHKFTIHVDRLKPYRDEEDACLALLNKDDWLGV